MSFHRYFKTNLILPMAREIGLSPRTLAEANKCVEQLFLATSLSTEEKQTKKRKYTTTFAPQDRADIGRYRYAAVSVYHDTLL